VLVVLVVLMIFQALVDLFFELRGLEVLVRHGANLARSDLR